MTEPCSWFTETEQEATPDAFVVALQLWRRPAGAEGEDDGLVGQRRPVVRQGGRERERLAVVDRGRTGVGEGGRRAVHHHLVRAVAREELGVGGGVAGERPGEAVGARGLGRRDGAGCLAVAARRGRAALAAVQGEGDRLPADPLPGDRVGQRAVQGDRLAVGRRRGADGQRGGRDHRYRLRRARRRVVRVAVVAHGDGQRAGVLVVGTDAAARLSGRVGRRRAVLGRAARAHGEGHRLARERRAARRGQRGRETRSLPAGG